jgi:hypothetical protein
MSANPGTEPPAAYWDALIAEANGSQPETLRDLFAQRVGEFTGIELPPPESTAIALLERVTADGWLRKEEREIKTDDGEVVTEIVYVRDLAQARVVDWVVALHGMNTAGAWQESFSWLLGTTWGRAVPVAVYKYGIVLTGVILAWRRNRLRRELRDKIAVLRAEAQARGYNGNPDLIAHSFGTWLFGHLLEHELARPANERLAFGRVILAAACFAPISIGSGSKTRDWSRTCSITTGPAIASCRARTRRSSAPAHQDDVASTATKRSTSGLRVTVTATCSRATCGRCTKRIGARS